MKKFTDKNKKDWYVDLTVGSAKRVKADCGIDLLNIIDFETKAKKSPLEELAENPMLVVDVLFSMCRKQAEERNIDDTAFAELFDGDVIQEAVDALLEEIINFSHPARRKVLLKIHEKNKQLAGEVERKIDEIISTPEFDNDLEVFMKSSSDSPESSE